MHNFQVLFRQCNYPKVIVFLLGTQAMFFFYLFGRFYIRMYVAAKKKNELINNNVQNGKIKSS